MAIRRGQVGSVVTLYAKGSFYGDRETDELQKAIMDEAAAGNTKLILNLAECEMMNSIAIGVLMRGFTNYKSRGGEIKLCSMGEKINNVFVVTKLIMVFDHHKTQEEALAAFAEGAGTTG